MDAGHEMLEDGNDTGSLPEADRSADVLLSLRDVDKTYHMGEVDVPVLNGIHLDVIRREIMVIVGPSGSGKSTLINLIGGIDTPSAGSVAFEGRDISRFGDNELTVYRREMIGFVFQFYNLVPTLTAEENVMVATQIAEDPLSPREALELVGLEHRHGHFPAQLSGGEQQRVAIARAIAKKPKLLLCDEPTGALDLTTGRIILEALARLKDELRMTIVIITHNSSIAALAHQVVHLGSGTITETFVNQQPAQAGEITW